MSSIALYPAAYAGTSSSTQEQYLPRSWSLPILFVVPIILTALSWLGEGVPFLTDIAFVYLTGLGIWLLILELLQFPRRFGIGGLVIFGGFLSWFCYDYLKSWFGQSFAASPISAEVIARVSFFHCVFLMTMVVGLLMPPIPWFVKPLRMIPEPKSPNLYFWLIVLAFAIGISPYFLFSSEPFYLAYWNSVVSGRTSGAAVWTIGRTGRYNTSWGGYIAQVLNVGQVAGQMAMVYAIVLTRDPLKRVACFLMWLIWVGNVIGTGTRGQIAFMVLPVAGVLFLQYQAQAAAVLKKIRWRAYGYAAIPALLFLVLVQVQGKYRNKGFENVDLKKISLVQLQGNSMFSEGLAGWEAVPARTGFFCDTFPGATLVRPLPDAAFWFFVKPIPRALWTNKPNDPAEEWYNDLATGGLGMYTTVAPGLVGDWYFKYGWAGVIQGALLFGWVARAAEVALQTAHGRMMTILMSLGVVTWLFRSFRGWNTHDLYPLMIGGVVFYFLIKFFNLIQPKA